MGGGFAYHSPMQGGEENPVCPMAKEGSAVAETEQQQVRDDLISIIVPLYNVAAYVEASLDSVLAQTHTNWELILVDDGSTDGTASVCDHYAERDSRIRVFHKKLGGAADARNAGLDEARGRYITFLDGDDYLSRDMMACLLAALLREDADVSMCNYITVQGRGGGRGHREEPIVPGVISGVEAVMRTFGDGSIPYVVPWNKLYKRELWDGIRFPSGQIREDEFVAHRVLSRCKRVVLIEDALYYYTQRSDSAMTNSSPAMEAAYYASMLDKCICVDELGEHEFAAEQFTFWSMAASKCCVELRNEPEAWDALRALRRQYRAAFFLRKNCNRRQRMHLDLIYVSPRLHEAVLGHVRKGK